jgi:hypothetical protein
MEATTNPAQIDVARRSSSAWRVTVDNLPINVVQPLRVSGSPTLIHAFEFNEHVETAVFDSAVHGYSLNLAAPGGTRALLR